MPRLKSQAFQDDHFLFLLRNIHFNLITHRHPFVQWLEDKNQIKQQRKQAFDAASIFYQTDKRNTAQDELQKRKIYQNELRKIKTDQDELQVLMNENMNIPIKKLN